MKELQRNTELVFSKFIVVLVYYGNSVYVKPFPLHCRVGQMSKYVCAQKLGCGCCCFWPENEFSGQPSIHVLWGCSASGNVCKR